VTHPTLRQAVEDATAALDALEFRLLGDPLVPPLAWAPVLTALAALDAGEAPEEVAALGAVLFHAGSLGPRFAPEQARIVEAVRACLRRVCAVAPPVVAEPPWSMLDEVNGYLKAAGVEEQARIYVNWAEPTAVRVTLPHTAPPELVEAIRAALALSQPVGLAERMVVVRGVAP
jgi:hypothetical protein